MSLLALRVEGASEQNVTYNIRVDRSWDAARQAFETSLRGGVSSAFQSMAVVDSWYRAMAIRKDLEPLFVSALDARTNDNAICLPLVRRRGKLLRVISFADDGLIDYNAPVLGSAAPQTPRSAAHLWKAIKKELPPADLIDFRKMPTMIGQRRNPLALLPTLASALNGNVVRIGADYQGYLRKGLKRVVRKELERSWRVFRRHETATFHVAVDPLQRNKILAAIEDQQPRRMNYVGKHYELDRPEAADFYRRLIDADPHGKFVVIGALMAGEEVVGALMGLRSAHAFIMIRISASTDREWTNCSPGRLVIERTMAHLHEAGVREFDFSVGNYDYKRRFGVQPLELVDLVQPLTPLGLFSAATARGRAWLRQRPELEMSLRRVLGRQRATETLR